MRRGKTAAPTGRTPRLRARVEESVSSAAKAPVREARRRKIAILDESTTGKNPSSLLKFAQQRGIDSEEAKKAYDDEIRRLEAVGTVKRYVPLIAEKRTKNMFRHQARDRAARARRKA